MTSTFRLPHVPVTSEADTTRDFEQLQVLLSEGLTASNLKAEAVTESKLGKEAVTTAKIAKEAVTAAKIVKAEAWNAPTLLNSWVNVAAFETAGYMKNVLGEVRLKGWVKGGVSGKTIFTLPSGFRPGVVGNYAVAEAGSTACQMQVNAAGEVIPFFTGAAELGLSGVTFLAEL